MKYVVLLVGALLVFGASASAQEQVGTESTTVTPPPKKKSVYKNKVGSLLWIEGFAGPTTYDPDQFGSLNLGAQSPNAPQLSGPEYGASLSVGLGGFVLGPFFRWADYSAYNLMKIGLEIQGVFRFIPYVHPMVRLDLFYASTRNGNPWPGLTNTNTNGGGFTLGAGIRIPIIRWISIAATFDWSFIGLAVRADQADGNRVSNGSTGNQIGGTFALTFHFIQARK